MPTKLFSQRPFFILSSLLLLGMLMAAPMKASAAECGAPPLEAPRLPDGRRATTDDIRVARDAVLDYSGRVDAYLTCMDNRAEFLFTYMTEEQRNRWQEDLTNLHEQRRQLQVDMNEQIRVFRAQRS